MTINVLNKDGETEPFNSKRIRQKILEETELDKEEVNKITRSVLNTIKENYTDEISTSTIRALINQQLIKRGLTTEEEKSRKLGMSVQDFEDLLVNGCNDNANIGFSPEMIAKYAYDSIAKEYALLKMPRECAEAHKEGLIHIHDLEYYNTRPNCMNYDLRFFAKNGLKIDGKGDMGSVANPPKSIEVLLNHMLQGLMAGATVFSGGQGYVNFNTLLAPFCRGRTYKEIKQAIQGFIFNCNMSLICRGGQVLFSSIALDLSCPPVLRDEPAVSFGGITSGTYKDYQEEADMIFRAVCEVSNEKDGENAWHRFPNIMFNIREGDLDEYTGTCKLLHETGANNPTIYYNNCTGIEKSIMGCFSGDTKLHFWYNGTHYFETFSFIDKLINANYGVNNVNGFKILGLVDDEDTYWKNGEKVKYSSKVVEYVEAFNFIKNRNRKIYHIILEDGNEFDCDDTHTMIECNSYQKVGVYEAFVNHSKIYNVLKEQMDNGEGYFLTLSETYIKDIVSTDKYEDTYCFEADGTIIVDEFILTGNCRTALPMNYRGTYEEDCVNTGNFMYNTINLPLIALEVDGDLEKFYTKLNDVCEICYKSLLHRRETVIDIIYNKHIADFLLQKDKETGKPLWDIDRTTITLGYCGLNEALIVLTGKSITDEASEDLGVEIIEFINMKKEEFHNRDGLRWSVIASPAESTAHRFAEIIKQKYPEATVQGNKDYYYLTNSHHIPVSSGVPWIDHIRNARKFHHLSMGGALLHIWSGEVWSDPVAIWKLNKRILEMGNPIFWAYSKVFTFCRECQFTINDKLDVCPVCGSRDLRVYDRITGYYLPVDTYNNGKKQEFKERYRHVITEKR